MLACRETSSELAILQYTHAVDGVQPIAPGRRPQAASVPPQRHSTHFRTPRPPRVAPHHSRLGRRCHAEPWSRLLLARDPPAREDRPATAPPSCGLAGVGRGREGTAHGDVAAKQSDGERVRRSGASIKLHWRWVIPKVRFGASEDACRMPSSGSLSHHVACWRPRR